MTSTLVNLKAERLNRGLSLRDMAEECGVSFATIDRAERGARPTPASAKAIADYFGHRVTDIWPIDHDAAKDPA